MSKPRFVLAATGFAALLALSGCEKNPLIVKRSVCPAVAVPTYAGDMTLFTGAGRNATDVDVVASITNVRDTCVDTPATLASDVTYDVVARRSATIGARTVTLPVFSSIVQGGNLLVSKEISAVTLTFADGQARAIAHSGARASVARSAAQLPPAIQAKVSRNRKPGDADAAIDPLADPSIRAAVRAVSFEVLVGFQLDEAGLAYNVTK